MNTDAELALHEAVVEETRKDIIAYRNKLARKLVAGICESSNEPLSYSAVKACYQVAEEMVHHKIDCMCAIRDPHTGKRVHGDYA